MAYYKVIVSGTVIEVYEYEKDPIHNDKIVDDDKYNQYEKVLLGKDEDDWIHEEIDRTEKRRKQTMREARNLTRRLALMNFSGGGCSFVTLTYPDTRHLTINDIAIADDDFKKFMKRLRYKYKKNFKYIAVREFTKRGRIHFHMLIDYEIHDTSEAMIREIEGLWGRTIWKHGFVDIKPLADVDNVGAYLIKYMTKGISLEAFKGHKAYLCSKGLDRPMEYRRDEAEAILKAYKLDHKKEVFTNSYVSEYLGSVSYKEYNLQRLN